MADWDEIDRHKGLASQAKSAAMGQALDFAMQKSDFSQSECDRFLKMGFDAGNGEVYSKALGWLAAKGLASSGDARRLAREAYFALSPSALGAICALWPEVFDDRQDGIDLLRSGLVMAIVQGDKEGAMSLAQASLSVSEGPARVKSAFEQAISECERISRDSNGAGGLGRAAELISRCENALLASLTAPLAAGAGRRVHGAL